MKLANKMDRALYPDQFLRRATAWACRAVGCPARAVIAAEFKYTRRHLWRGWARQSWRRGSVVLMVRRDGSGFPHHDARIGSSIVLGDQIEALILVLAHELEHVRQYASGEIGKLRDGGGLERSTRRAASAVLEQFRAARPELVTAWAAGCFEDTGPAPMRCAADSSGRPGLVQERARHAAAKLTEWERRKAAAERMRAKWARKVKYYQDKGIEV